ncbi:heavy-metal-associated domain-containing protein [Natronorubrum sp. DTA7]|uniref:heavy-metal-associated domain-containing protein n=1 Tax=Natronorubrum sp. DTA7 TaxID=3447016 RepID=UPI003F87C3C7
MERTTLTVDGMACDGCEATVTEALESLKGVVSATADHETAAVRIEYDEGAVDEATFGSTIENAGYAVPS